MLRPSARARDELREVKITRNYTCHAEGSVLIEMGETKVICTASLLPGVPRFLKGEGKGWITAEYGMLPRATSERVAREKLKPSGRTMEIQRLIGRVLRTCVDLKAMGEYTIHIDCDVIQADGGTRTASITGGFVALYDALKKLQQRRGKNGVFAVKSFLASVSVGMYEGESILDLDYKEDSNALTDMNVVMDESGRFVEIQGTAEQEPFEQEHLAAMLGLAKSGIKTLVFKQKQALGIV